MLHPVNSRESCYLQKPARGHTLLPDIAGHPQASRGQVITPTSLLRNTGPTAATPNAGTAFKPQLAAVCAALFPALALLLITAPGSPSIAAPAQLPLTAPLSHVSLTEALAGTAEPTPAGHLAAALQVGGAGG